MKNKQELQDIKMAQKNQRRFVPVTIGMPVYNGQKYIREALDSLLSQSFEEFELIISDNASTDATETICREYASKDSRISYVRQQTNIGAPANFLYVLEQAVGDHFMWAACDDRWSHDWLERMHRALAEPDVGMVFGQLAHIDATGNAINHMANEEVFNYGKGVGPVRSRLMYYLAYEGAGKANAIYSLYKRELLDPLAAMWREVIHGRALYDYTIIYNCLGYKEIKQVEHGTLFKRVHGESEGSNREGQYMSFGYVVSKAAGLIWPFPPRLFRDYLRYSTKIEKPLLLIFFPVKLLVAYRHRIKQVVSMIKR